MKVSDLIGSWENESHNKLIFRKTDETSLKVTFISGKLGTPVKREYFLDRETIDMNATLDSYHGEIEVDLWEKGKGYSLFLNYDYSPTKNNPFYPLVPGISRNEEDEFLDKYSSLFEPLQKYYKIIEKQKAKNL